MKRPYVICHILSSLDGKITGSWCGVWKIPDRDERRRMAVRNCHDKGVYRFS